VTEQLFAFDNRNYKECQKAFRGERNQEYYLGDYSIEAGSVIDVRAERKGVGSCSIIRLRSRTRLFFRRSWSHIREDATDVTVLWFVKRGSLAVTRQGGCFVASAGDIAITKSMSPFAMECLTDEESVHEVLHVVVPTHVFRSFVAQDVGAGLALPGGAREFRIAERMLNEVFDDVDELSAHVEQLLVDSALAVLADAVKECSYGAPARKSLSDKRLQDVLRFVEIHLSDPKLSTTMVASACGISPRYLSYLLKQNGTSFSALVWDERLKVASRWLASPEACDVSMAEIAFRVGFKSPAHFSRMFKRVFSKGPREYRATVQGAAAQTPADCLTRATLNTLQ